MLGNSLCANFRSKRHRDAIHFKVHILMRVQAKAELLQLNHTQFPSLGFFVSKKVGNRKN